MDPQAWLPQLRPPDPDAAWKSGARPWVTVEAFSDFAICRRAGQLTWEDERFQPAEPIKLRNWLGFNPAKQYVLAEIKHELDAISGPAQRWAVFYVAFFSALASEITGIGQARLPWNWFYFLRIFWWQLEVTALCSSPVAGYYIYKLWMLTQREHLAKHSRPDEPDPHFDKPQPVNWWSLHNANFDSVIPRQDYVHDAWGLCGRPWRVLRRGGKVVPVILCSPPRGPSDQPIDHRYVLQALAYCELVSICEGSPCPYAVLIRRGSYDGFAITPRPAFRDDIVAALQAFRQQLVAAERKLACAPAPEPAVCQYCRFGKPRVLRPHRLAKPSSGTSKPLHGVSAANRKSYHSPCGDEFQWVPPHADAERLGLTSR